MSEFWLFIKLGITHVLDWQAYDHLLFLVVLSVGFSFSSWKKLLILVSLFTLGHTASLLIAHYNILQVSSNWIEFLIPLTILATAIYNLVKIGQDKTKENIIGLYIVTIFFGLIHGFGFSSYYSMLSPGEDLSPLIAFALGIEFSQLVVALGVLILHLVLQKLFQINQRDWIMVVSSIVIGLVIPMLL